ncbi:2-amino-4-hydroxy-6-hydroxymethyldihydropteridine diphosphokinase [Mucilaginibacter sp. KACC 22063]|uniref:2-amino-4-hydroxy-6- hydroxymethyldihydropteridine diphosphokinase n=1 Tax=Mucilaginibacter sp. KACC 22063 TaxID=3025666 RepID=UPI002364FCB6|nr:2-amino-4-hydroxy-6-hydroxymethyldihydropteridine diphosphokinase [Mucilaginibacter sp. KACC 22063]WDF54101.1 2-amino-4-hydroxy-6-hydroxymethyldihydropteridine diphosphokinase [Mucilaginibacter sp. KACC 22063]
MINVFLLLGSNLGNREEFIKKAVEQIGEFAAVLKTSSLYETQAWGKEGEPDYLNQVVEIATDMKAHNLLAMLLNIEQRLGRLRNEKWGSRTIDIDILFYGNLVIDDADLTVPHPRLHERRFTLEPLEEIAAELIHPVFKKNITQLKKDLKDSLIVKKL